MLHASLLSSLEGPWRGKGKCCTDSFIPRIQSYAAQVTIALYHLLGVLLKREQFLHVTTVGYSAVIFGWASSYVDLWSGKL